MLAGNSCDPAHGHVDQIQVVWPVDTAIPFMADLAGPVAAVPAVCDDRDGSDRPNIPFLESDPVVLRRL